MRWIREEGSAWIGRGGDPSVVATPLGDTSRGSEASELLIDLIDCIFQLFLIYILCP